MNKKTISFVISTMLLALLVINYSHKPSNNITDGASSELIFKAVPNNIADSKAVRLNKLTKELKMGASLRGDDHTPDLSEIYPLEQEYMAMGYSERAAKILATKNPKETISIEDSLDASERRKMYACLEARRELGYFKITKAESDDIHQAVNNIYDSSQDYNNLNFTPSALPPTLKNHYNYIGYSYDYNFRFYPLGSKSSTLRRVLNNDIGTTIILDEESIINGETHSTEEFVTHRINGYPATIEKIQASDDAAKAYHLVVGTEDYDYAVYLINDKMGLNQATNELLQIGNELIKLNTKTNPTKRAQK